MKEKLWGIFVVVAFFAVAFLFLHGCSIPEHRHIDDIEQEAYDRGYNDGECDGYEAGYDDGEYAGYEVGYDDGYSDGYNDGINEE